MIINVNDIMQHSIDLAALKGRHTILRYLEKSPGNGRRAQEEEPL
jgi:hypothetical protein